MSDQTIRCTRCGPSWPLVAVDAMSDHMWADHGVLEVRWGYALADLQTAAQWAVRNMRGWYVTGHDTLVEAAYDGIVDKVLTAEHWPSPYELHGAADLALGYYRNSIRSTYGITPAGGAQTAPRWALYWLGVPQVTRSHEDGIVERLTLPTLLDALTGRQRQVITAMAATDGDREIARGLVGLTASAFRQQLRSARDRCAALWHEHDTPARPTTGHLDRRPLPDWASPCGTRNGAVRHRRRHEPRCEPCIEAERAYSAGRQLARAGASGGDL